MARNAQDFVYEIAAVQRESLQAHAGGFIGEQEIVPLPCPIRAAPLDRFSVFRLDDHALIQRGDPELLFPDIVDDNDVIIGGSPAQCFTDASEGSLVAVSTDEVAHGARRALGYLGWLGLLAGQGPPDRQEQDQ